MPGLTLSDICDSGTLLLSADDDGDDGDDGDNNGEIYIIVKCLSVCHEK